jgi:plastocyanin
VTVRIATALIASLLLVGPAAQAATKEVAAGPSAAALKATKLKVPTDAEFDLFARRTITINVRDRVRWKINGRHTVTFLNGHRRPGLLAVDSKARVSGLNDAAGKPFWFNGKPTTIYNPAVLSAKGGSTFTRGRLLSSGLKLDSTRARTFTVRFNRKGRFSYVCLVHPGMKGTVVVRSRRAKVPRRTEDRARARKEIKAAVQGAIVKEGAVVVPAQAGGTTLIQAGNDGPGFSVFKYFPHQASVPVNVGITVRVSPRSDQNHTFTFGPADQVKALQNGLVVKKSARRFELAPQAVWASDQPLPPFAPAVHGNGFLNTGILDAGALGDSPLPLSSNATLTFTTPGTYTMYCLVHPQMTATIEVVG